MVKDLLASISAVVLLVGLLDLPQTSEDQSPPVVRAESCPRPGMGQRYVRVNSALATAPIAIYRINPELSRFRLRFPLVPFGTSAATSHAVVRIRPPLELTGKWQIFPPPASLPVYGLLSALPREMVPVPGAGSLPAETAISVLDESVGPPTLMVPILMVLLGGLAAFMLTSGPDEASETPAPTADDWTPFFRTEPARTEAYQYVGVTAMLALLLAGPRYFRIGGPHLYDSVTLTLLYSTAAMLAGYTAFRKATNQLHLCPAGIEFPMAGPAHRHLPWSDLHAMRRDRPQPGVTDGYDMIFSGKSFWDTHIELGNGGAASQAAADLARRLAPVVLTPISDQLTKGLTHSFESLRVSNLGVAWEEDSGWRQVEFDDLERAQIKDGVLSFRLIATQWDAFSCHYQELPNGFVIPSLLLGVIRKNTLRCQISWESEPLAGMDAWLASTMADAAVHPGPPPGAAPPIQEVTGQYQVAVLAQRHGRFEDAASTYIQVLATFEAQGHEDTDCQHHSLQSLGCILLDRGSVVESLPLLDRAVALLESLQPDRAEDLARALHNRAVAHWRSEKFPEAARDSIRATELYGQRSEAHPVHVARSLSMLACLRSKAGQPAPALKLLHQAFVRLEEAAAGGPINLDPRELDGMVQNVAELLGNHAGRQQSLQARAVALSRAVYGSGALATAHRLDALSQAALSAGDLVGARQACEEALGLYECLAGEEDRRTGECIDRIGEISWAQGEMNAATTAWEIALAILESSDVTNPRWRLLHQRMSGQMAPDGALPPVPHGVTGPTHVQTSALPAAEDPLRPIS